MKYSEVLEAVEVTMFSGNVPFIIGHAGIGKSQIPIEIAKKYQGMKIVTLYGSLMKEGELGGLPISRKNKKGEVVNDYTTYIKLYEILKNTEKGIYTILFIDEINRSEYSVQQELMQLVQDRRINNVILPDECYIICAGNPEIDDVNDYQVNVMNSALKSRFIWFDLDSSVDEWLKWANRPLQLIDENNNVINTTMIDEDIINFIGDYPELLHQPELPDDVKPNPRSWHKLSDIKRTMLSLNGGVDTELLFNIAKGSVGLSAASSLIQFLNIQQNPLIDVEVLFKSKGDNYQNILESVKKETHARLTILAQRVLNYLNNEKELTKAIKDRFINFCNVLPKDLMVGYIIDISKNHKNLHETLIRSKDYLDLYYDTMKRTTLSLENIMKED